MNVNLFDTTKGIENPCSVKPRAANDAEIFAYLEWQRQRHNLADLEQRELCWLESNHGRTRSTLHRICIGATFGQRMAAPGWRGEGSGREYFPAEYENGAYSIVMPGWNAHRQNVTMETLDDAGEVVASQTLPAEPKKGGVIWDKAAVHKAAGPVAKAAKASKRKPTPTVEIEAPASAPQEPQERVEAVEATPTALEPVSCSYGPEIGCGVVTGESRDMLDAQGEAMAAFIETLDTLPAISAGTPTARAKRTPAHERAIRRAWAARAERRLLERRNAYLSERRSEAVRKASRQRSRYLGLSERYGSLAAASEKWEALRWKQWEKRRRSTLLARQRGKGLVLMHNVARARLDELQADLAKARQAPTYFDENGMERHDAAAVAFDQGRHALDKAESLERTVEGAKAVAVRQQRAIETLADELETMTARALKAERALAAVTARRDGWPPAVRSVGVNFALAG